MKYDYGIIVEILIKVFFKRIMEYIYRLCLILKVYIIYFFFMYFVKIERYVIWEYE